MNISKIVAGAALATSLVAGAAQATPVTTINGTAAVSMIGVSVNTALIGVGTTFTNIISVPGFGTLPGFSVIIGGGDFVPATSTQYTMNPITATVGSSTGFTASFGSFSGTVESVDISGTSDKRTLSAYILGTFTPAGVLSAFGAGPASLTFSATQTGGPWSSVSASYSLSSPPAGVPEPMSLALFGTALAGLGLARRKRRA